MRQYTKLIIILKIRAIHAITTENLATPPSPELYSGSLLSGRMTNQRISIISEQTVIKVKSLKVSFLPLSALTRTWIATAHTVKLMKSALKKHVKHVIIVTMPVK